MDQSHILDLVREHGEAAYAIVFAYSASHSMLIVLFAGYAAQSGALDFLTLVMVCWAGSCCGDMVRFWIGRRFGTRWLSPFSRLERGVQLAGRLVDRHYLWIPLVHRYPYGIRGLAAFAFGISRLPRSTFLALNFVSAGLWAAVVASIGYAFGHVASGTAMNEAASAVGVATMLVFVGLVWLLGRRLERAVERG
jgi:membrane protein DedA with SNARE-associated domain